MASEVKTCACILLIADDLARRAKHHR
jgi:hypothetical protein